MDSIPIVITRVNQKGDREVITVRDQMSDRWPDFGESIGNDGKKLNTPKSGRKKLPQYFISRKYQKDDDLTTKKVHKTVENEANCGLQFQETPKFCEKKTENEQIKEKETNLNSHLPNRIKIRTKKQKVHLQTQRQQNSDFGSLKSINWALQNTFSADHFKQFSNKHPPAKPLNPKQSKFLKKKDQNIKKTEKEKENLGSTTSKQESILPGIQAKKKSFRKEKSSRYKFKKFDKK